jgi:hypothetical protein
LREACTSVALGLGGWGKHSKAKNRKSRQPPRRSPVRSARINKYRSKKLD